MARNNLLTYPYFNETYKIYTDDSAFQLGAVVSRKVKPVAFYSRTINDSKKQYTVIDSELIRIVETLKEFITILLGQKLRIYTDHKNLTCNYFITN